MAWAASCAVQPGRLVAVAWAMVAQVVAGVVVVQCQHWSAVLRLQSWHWHQSRSAVALLLALAVNFQLFLKVQYVQ